MITIEQAKRIADAIGLDVEIEQGTSGAYLHNWETGCEFNPSEDLADVFEIAARMHMNIKHLCGAHGRPDRVIIDNGYNHKAVLYDVDPVKATQQAILAAAVEMTKE